MTIDFLFSCLASCWKVLTQRSTDRDSLKHLIGCSSKFSFPDREYQMTGNCNNCQKNSLSINSFRALLVSALLKWMPWLSVKLNWSYSLTLWVHEENIFVQLVHILTPFTKQSQILSVFQNGYFISNVQCSAFLCNWLLVGKPFNLTCSIVLLAF